MGNNTRTYIKPTALRKLKKLAEQDRRTICATIEMLVDAELERRRTAKMDGESRT